MVTIFNDETGNVSSMNFVWVVSLITIIGTWIALSIKLHDLQHVTGGDALWFATLFSGKVLQNFFEAKYKKPEDTTVESGMMQDNQGRTSIARILWVLATLGIVFTWAYLSWTTDELKHFSTGDAAWFGALFGSKIGGTVIEREFGIKDADDERDMMYARYRGADDGDSDPDEGDYSMMDGYGYGSGGNDSTSEDKDKLIRHLQNSLEVQNQFNKNLVKKIDPSMNIKTAVDNEVSGVDENTNDKENKEDSNITS